jgi:hypothetical protein
VGGAETAEASSPPPELCLECTATGSILSTGDGGAPFAVALPPPLFFSGGLASSPELLCTFAVFMVANQPIFFSSKIKKKNVL